MQAGEDKSRVLLGQGIPSPSWQVLQRGTPGQTPAVRVAAEEAKAMSFRFCTPQFQILICCKKSG